MIRTRVAILTLAITGAWLGLGQASRAAGLTADQPEAIGSTVYKSQCAVCHKGNRKGSPPAFPSLIDVDKRLTDSVIIDRIHQGKGMMPSFPNVTDAEMAALLRFLKTSADSSSAGTSRGSGEQPVAGNLSETAGAKLYGRNCAICHGEDMLGAPSNYPALVGVRNRLQDQQILENIHHGKGRMPAFKKLSDADTAAILRFLGDSAASIPTPSDASSDASSNH